MQNFQYLKSIPNYCPLLLRANEPIENIGLNKRTDERVYCFMGSSYGMEMIPNKYSGIYHRVETSGFLDYDTRKNIYLSSVIALGYHSNAAIEQQSISQRIFEGMSYGCIVLTNSLTAEKYTDGICIYVKDKKEAENKIQYYLDNPEERKEKQEKGYKWVLMFDQDSNPFSDIINNFILSYNDYPFKNKIGMIGLNAYDQNNNVYVNIISSNNYKKRDYLITSGCLISTKVYNSIGKFNESYFIDNVDIEYSLRVRKAKFILLITKKPGMIHKAGDTLTKKIFGFEFESSNHNSLRRYYMTRNHFCLSKKYFYTFPFFIMKLNIFFFLSIISMLIIEKDRKNKLKSILKGLFKL